MTVQDIRTV
jgi:transposase